MSNTFSKYQVGNIISVKINKMLSFGLLVEITDNTQGIIHFRELSWKDYEVKNPQKFFQKGQHIKALIYDIDLKRNRILLSRRLAERDPWQTINQKYQVGKIVKAGVTGVTRAHIFAEIEMGVQAICSIEQSMSKIKLESQGIVLPGDTIIGKILDINQQSRLIRIELITHANELNEGVLKEIFTIRGLKQDKLCKPFDISSLEKDRFDVNKGIDHSLKTTQSYQELRKDIQHILVVDDDPALSDSIKETLDKLGYAAKNVYSTKQALILLESANHDFDLVFIDIAMPEVDGITLAHQINEQYPQIPIILITGKSVNQISSKLDEIPIVCLLHKPFGKEQLEEAIHEAITYENKATEEYTVIGENSPLDSQNIQGIVYESESKYARQNYYDLKIRKILERLVRETSARAAAVFSLHPITFNTQLLSEVGIDQNIFYKVRHRLRYSPVKDVIFDKETLNDSDVISKEGKYRNLLKLIHFTSCIGIRLDASGEEGQGFFLFNPRLPNFASPDDLFHQAELATIKIESILKEKKFAQWSEKDQRFMLDGQLLTGLAHELKTRLTTLQFQTDLLNSILQSDTKNQDIFNMIRNKVVNITTINQEMGEIVKNLLRFSKKGKEEAVDVNKCIEEVLFSLAPLAREANIRFDTYFDSNLPTANCMKIRLEQVFLNITLNAIQNMAYFGKSGGQLIITTKHDLKNDYPIKIEFFDTGPGIHGKDFNKIFEPLYTTKPEGHGMGLAISRGILHALGGKIYVNESVMFSGSTFIVELP